MGGGGGGNVAYIHIFQGLGFRHRMILSSMLANNSALFNFYIYTVIL